jgi:hypothetical protein
VAQTSSGIRFGPYRLEVGGRRRLWKGSAPVPLQPRPLSVLSYLAARPGVVVGRDELIATLWNGTHVTRAVLKVAVRAIREALEDEAGAPRYIETVGREGYRFIGAGAAGPGGPRAGLDAGAAVMVGRAPELARLHAALARAATGARTIVFVSGEAGIGKTTLLDRFVQELDPAGGVLVGRGQCLEQYGVGEAYLPVLEALGRLIRDDATGEFMLRELADALEVFTSRHTLLLVLEDLQWSDPSTIDLLGCLARRRQAARLLVIGSLCPVQPTAGDHPLRGVQRDLQAKGLYDVIALELLSRAEVAVMVNLVDDLVAGGLLAWRDGRWHVEGSTGSRCTPVPGSRRVRFPTRCWCRARSGTWWQGRACVSTTAASTR